MKKILMLAPFLLTSTFAEQINVTATKVPMPLEKTASAVTIITSDDIENSTASTIEEVLQSSAGISTSNAGIKGSNSSIFLRGTNSTHLVVIIDGVKISNPVGTNNGLQNLDLDTIESIEVLKGSQSVLYGADAIGGVIKITTKKGTNKLLGGNVSGEVGSGEFYNTNFNVGGEIKTVNYAINYAKSYEKAISSLSANSEKDEADLENINVKLSANLSKNIEARINFQAYDNTVQYDNYLDPNDGLDHRNISKQQKYSGELRGLFFDGFLETIATASKVDFESEDPTSNFRRMFKGGTEEYEIQNNLYLDDENTFVFGINRFDSRDQDNGYDQNSTGIYTLYNYLSKSYFINTGARYDENSKFKDKLTYKVAPGIYLNEMGTKAFVSYATNFKAPSLYQLFDSSYGNQNLNPEEGESFDVGITQEYKKSYLTLTYFYQKLDESINYDFSESKYVNEGEQKSQGAELELSTEFSQLRLNGNYTYTRATDKKGKQLERRPKNQALLQVSYTPIESLSFGLSGNFKGNRMDQQKNMHGYSTYDFITRYKLSKKNTDLSLSVTNLTDKDYEDISGYSTYGRSYYAKINWKF